LCTLECTVVQCKDALSIYWNGHGHEHEQVLKKLGSFIEEVFCCEDTTEHKCFPGFLCVCLHVSLYVSNHFNHCIKLGVEPNRVLNILEGI
jgi:hypothetical protein